MSIHRGAYPQEDKASVVTQDHVLLVVFRETPQSKGRWDRGREDAGKSARRTTIKGGCPFPFFLVNKDVLVWKGLLTLTLYDTICCVVEERLSLIRYLTVKCNAKSADHGL